MNWAIFRGYLVEANDDGTIPLNARVIAKFAEGDEPVGGDYLAIINAPRVLAVLESITNVIASKSTSPTYAHQLSNMLPTLIATVRSVKGD